MARTGNNQRSANRVAVDVGATGTKPASKGAVLILVVCVFAAVWAVAMMTAPGRVGYVYFYMYSTSMHCTLHIYMNLYYTFDIEFEME